MPVATLAHHDLTPSFHSNSSMQSWIARTSTPILIVASFLSSTFERWRSRVQGHISLPTGEKPTKDLCYLPLAIFNPGERVMTESVMADHYMSSFLGRCLQSLLGGAMRCILYLHSFSRRHSVENMNDIPQDLETRISARMTWSVMTKNYRAPWPTIKPLRKCRTLRGSCINIFTSIVQSQRFCGRQVCRIQRLHVKMQYHRYSVVLGDVAQGLASLSSQRISAWLDILVNLPWACLNSLKFLPSPRRCDGS